VPKMSYFLGYFYAYFMLVIIIFLRFFIRFYFILQVLNKFGKMAKNARKIVEMSGIEEPGRTGLEPDRICKKIKKKPVQNRPSPLTCLSRYHQNKPPFPFFFVPLLLSQTNPGAQVPASSSPSSISSPSLYTNSFSLFATPSPPFTLPLPRCTLSWHPSPPSMLAS